MWALEQAWAPPRLSLLAGTPLPLIGCLAGGWLAVAGLVAAGLLGAAALGPATVTAAHGGLLATAMAWNALDSGTRLSPRELVVTIVLLGAGSAAVAIDPRAAALALATPAWLLALARRGRLVGLGLASHVEVRPVLQGAMLGALLAAHLLVSAAQTLGYPLRGGGWIPILALVAYDVGANILSAECFFRGALFNRLQRRWPFGAAAALATTLSLLRYLVDPLLPGQVEVMVGALFYLSLLGVVNCWLLWWSGSLAPGLLASLIFFVAYRMLAMG